ncbi:hypothetical protein HPB48_012884 [Haemaphysalis longicornis]|uniref:SOCS box domain-containing protein n=1 Tax=Haemaphysalis longicornis TaxID=44386 RepID=A0A9J6H5I7_HAELO|nr:hypothetical protein HPB48_012884 [Haemaphysalis longicornis]
MQSESEGEMDVFLSHPSPEEDGPPFFLPFLLHKRTTSTIFKSHVCRNSLEAFVEANVDPASNLLRRRTVLDVCVACITKNLERDITERSIDVLLSCAACICELCMVTVVKKDSLTEEVLRKFRVPTKQRSVAYTSLFEAVLFRATTADLAPFYGNAGGPAELACVKLPLCRCHMRPLYAAIYFSNVQVVSTLLRYGAEVRPEDTCNCEEPRRMHPLLRVYTMLSGIYCNRVPAVDFVRCHQLAALVMPCHDAVLREGCFSLVEAYTPDEEYESLLREKRSLQHFCRLSLRAALYRRRAMPKGVEQLPLPKLLQRYILYQYGPGCV